MPIEFDLTGLHDEHTIRANVPPPLSELCVGVLAANFANRPTLRGIAPRYINRMTELLPTDLPLEVTGPLIDDEGYWKRCATARWDNCQISDHGSSWKRALCRAPPCSEPPGVAAAVASSAGYRRFTELTSLFACVLLRLLL